MATGDKKRAVMTTDINNAGSDYPVMPLKVIDSAPDPTHTGNLISSAAVAEGLATKVDKTDLASIQATGTTNTTGATITAGTYFYLNGVLVQAITDIGSGATFTSGTNYETITAGGLNALRSSITALGNVVRTVMLIISGNGGTGTFEVPRKSNGVIPGFLILGARSNIGTVCVFYDEWGEALTIVNSTPSNWSIAWTHSADGTKAIGTITNNGVSAAHFQILMWDF